MWRVTKWLLNKTWMSKFKEAWIHNLIYSTGRLPPPQCGTCWSCLAFLCFISADTPPEVDFSSLLVLACRGAEVTEDTEPCTLGVNDPTGDKPSVQHSALPFHTQALFHFPRLVFFSHHVCSFLFSLLQCWKVSNHPTIGLAWKCLYFTFYYNMDFILT